MRLKPYREVSGCFTDLSPEAIALTKFPLQQIAHHHQTGPRSSGPVFPLQVVTGEASGFGFRLGKLVYINRHMIIPIFN